MEVGEVIRDYVLESRIGAGGAGEVWRARHRHIGKHVAIKAIFRNLSTDLNLRERVIREAAAIANLRHPYIVQLHEFFFLNDQPHLVMDYIDGRSLQFRIDDSNRPSVDEALSISRDILSALNYAHTEGVVHRDVKPANILLGQDGHAYITDFAIDLMLGKTSTTQYGETVGTPEYMSPEQIKGGRLDHRTDVYSFGCVLYEMLTGKPPYGSRDKDALTDFAIITQHLNSTPVPVREINPAVDGNVSRIIQQALRKDPNLRPGGCGEMMAALLGMEKDKATRYAGYGERTVAATTWKPTNLEELPQTLISAIAVRARIMLPETWLPVPNDRVTFEDSAYSSPFPEGTQRTSAVVKRDTPAKSTVIIRRLLLLGISVAAFALIGWLGGKIIPLLFGSTQRTKLSDYQNGGPKTYPVDCSVFAPPKLVVGNKMLVQVFLHPLGQDQEVGRAAHSFDEEAEWRGFTSLSLELADGARIGLQLEVGDLSVSDEGFGEIRWNKHVAGLTFIVGAPADIPVGKRFLTARVFANGCPAGRIHFAIEVVSAMETSVPPEPLGDDSHRYRKAFIAYASKDKTEVLKRVQTLGALNIDYYQDVLNLEPGERWEKELYNEIDNCDVFLLFWSSAARSSEWVYKETKYALECQNRMPAGEPDIVPVIIEGPPPPQPWRECAHLHFNDKLIYFMQQ